NKDWFLVDLPGYGYAKISKKEKRKIENIIIDYFTNRSNITLTFLLVDIRHNPQQIDLEFMDWLNNNNIDYKLIFTKDDKLKISENEKKAKDYIETIYKQFLTKPEFIISSSTTKKGRKKILNLIFSKI
ncbi:MAG: YihA family ribosome biogenesis GTP-binding protein, partial [Flavobacteriaceae bacterium]|nr:YihA family ribosome biogenesis GTP-binding protein [Flavobacteriaceae bacterium]